jgi:uncharacterized SAM-binding protein YcdF (DUF218 family)
LRGDSRVSAPTIMATLVTWLLRMLGVSAVALVIGFVWFATLVFQSPLGAPPEADGIVALTGGGARIEEALRLLGDHKAKRLLITGVNPRTSRASLERIAPDHQQLFDCCIDIGYWAQDTFGNADEAEAWARQHGFTRLIVVTSRFHMPRSLAELTRAMPEVQLIPHAVAPTGDSAGAWWISPSATRHLVVEYLKYLPAIARLELSRAFDRGGSAGGETASASADGF